MNARLPNARHHVSERQAEAALGQADLLGQPVRQTTAVGVFHDERKWGTWLYHGLLVVERHQWAQWAQWAKRLEEARLETGCTKAVHFKELKDRSGRSSRQKLACHWSSRLDTEYLPLIRFFLLGIDLSKLDRERFGGSDSTAAERQMRIYNRFFEIAVFTALRWCFTHHHEVELSGLFAETRNLPDDDPFLRHAPYRIARRESNIRVTTQEVRMIDAKAEEEDQHPGLRDSLQLVDALTGGFAHLLDNPIKKAGCCQIAEILAPRARKLVEAPLNVQSSCWKRITLRFFPGQTLSERQLMAGNGASLMYESRSLAYADRDQGQLFT